jgi:hypothetical protein
MSRNAEQGSKQLLQSLKFSFFIQYFYLEADWARGSTPSDEKVARCCNGYIYNIYQRVRNSTRGPRSSPPHLSISWAPSDILLLQSLKDVAKIEKLCGWKLQMQLEKTVVKHHMPWTFIELGNDLSLLLLFLLLYDRCSTLDFLLCIISLWL